MCILEWLIFIFKRNVFTTCMLLFLECVYEVGIQVEVYVQEILCE